MTTPAQSNQNAGANERSCPWCDLWNAAFSASRLDWRNYGGEFEAWCPTMFRISVTMLRHLANRETKCELCQRSAEIYRGNVLGHEAAAWRAEMYAKNPSMHFMMQAGKGDTFEEVKT